MTIKEEKPLKEANPRFRKTKYTLVLFVFFGVFTILEIIKNQDPLAKGIFLGFIFSLAPIILLRFWYEDKFRNNKEEKRVDF